VHSYHFNDRISCGDNLPINVHIRLIGVSLGVDYGEYKSVAKKIFEPLGYTIKENVITEQVTFLDIGIDE
jgi:arginine deiminase